MDDALTLSFLEQIREILEDDYTQHKISKIEKIFLQYCLKRCYGNRTKTAKYAGISIRTLRNKIHKYPEIIPTIKINSNEEELQMVDKSMLRELEPSLGAKRNIVKDITNAKEVYHIRGIFNSSRQFFNYSEVKKAAYTKLEEFKESLCSLSRESAEDLIEDIEIYEENPEIHVKVMVVSRNRRKYFT